VTKPRNKFDHRAMTETELSNALGDHVHQDFRVSNNFGGGFD
jgi:hypothetical protein